MNKSPSERNKTFQLKRALKAEDELAECKAKLAALEAALAQPVLPAPMLGAAFAIDAACRDRYPQWDNPRYFGEIAKQMRRREMASEVLAQPAQPATREAGARE